MIDTVAVCSAVSSEIEMKSFTYDAMPILKRASMPGKEGGILQFQSVCGRPDGIDETPFLILFKISTTNSLLWRRYSLERPLRT